MVEKVGLMWLWIVLASLIAVPVSAAAESGGTRSTEGLGSSSLPVATAIRPQIEFWKKVFAVYGDNQVVLHDSEDLNRIYRVLDFTDLAETGLSAAETQRVRDENVAAEREYIRTALLHIQASAGDVSELNNDERRWALLFKGESSDEILAAAQPDRIRAQRGIKERFANGIAIEHRYTPELERIFVEEGVPRALTRLSLVESCFNVHAYSKVGATGVWQFMPATGRLFMRVDDVIDERRDPVIAGRAAARFLRRNYDRLGTWPLAITAYNHGPNGIANAIEATNSTDIATIIRQYHGPLFGFASRNFYPEFVAAVEVDDRYPDYFPDLEVSRPVATEPVHFSRQLNLATAAHVCGVDRDTFVDLNPALGDAVRSNRAAVPAGFDLRVPAGHGQEAHVRYASLPEPVRVASASSSRTKKTVAKRGRFVVHKVRKGQTLTQIAKQYGTSVEALRATNRLNHSGVHAGQTLKVPAG